MKRLFVMSAILLFSSSVYADPLMLINQNHILFTLIGFFGLGFLLAFTPCVFPMVPILSAILIGQQRTGTLHALKLSSVFVFSMALTYALAGMVAGYLGGTIQTALQTPGIIIGFSLVFVIMALSMFGLFDLAMPRALQNYIYQINQRQKGGHWFGVAIMGILSTLIASPCITPPLVSVLTYIGQTGNSLLGGLILFVLALGMGMPLILFGMGQGALLPKAGIWMKKIKYLFGLMMLGMAIWMTSRILSDNVTMFLWSAWLMLGGILFGALNFRGQQRQPVVRGISVIVLIYGVMLMAGAVTGRDSITLPLQPFISANADSNSSSVGGLFSTVTTLSEVNQKLEQAKMAKKPVIMEFYASWCSICRAFDRSVLSDKKIQKRMGAFEAIRVDVTEQNEDSDALLKYFNVYGTPTFLFYDKNGSEMTSESIAGGVNKKTFEQTLDRVAQAG